MRCVMPSGPMGLAALKMGKIDSKPHLTPNNKGSHCGSTSNHCTTSKGCQHGCSGFIQVKKATQLQASTSAQSSEPIIKGTMSMAVAGGAETKDGTCGAKYNNTVCGNWANGNCCSMYGFWYVISVAFFVQ